MWGYSKDDMIGVCWLIRFLCWLGFDHALQRVGHEMTHQLGEPHHPYEHQCGMMPSGYDSWTHIRVDPLAAKAFLREKQWVIQ